MSLATPEGGNRDAGYPVISEIPLPAEITRAVRAANPLLSENTETLGAETAITIQTEWLGVIEAALSDLARRGINDPILAEAGAVAEKLRVAIASPAPGQPNHRTLAEPLRLYLDTLLAAFQLGGRQRSGPRHRAKDYRSTRQPVAVPKALGRPALDCAL